MGKWQSSIERRKKIEKLKQFTPPIQTRDKLLQTYARMLAGLHNIGRDQRRWFSEVFNEFCTQSESTKFKKVEDNGQPYNATGRLGHTCITYVEALAKATREDEAKQE